METFLENIFGGFFNEPKPMQTRPEVIRQMENQMIQPPVTEPGKSFFNVPGLFGIGNEGFITTSNNQPNTMQRGVSSVYDLETGQMRIPQGVFTGAGQPETSPGILDSLSNMTPDETMNLISGVSGLLNTTQPQTMDLSPASMPSASAGLRLQPVDLNQFYKGLI